jgi:nucleoside-diphosphate-sugar epimerase
MIVVTGATGFIGGAVARTLVARGEAVRGLVRAASNATTLEEAGVAVVRGDVTDPSGLEEAFAGARAVVHAAGMLGVAGAQDEAYERVHVLGTMNVVRKARAAGIGRVVHISSPGLLGPIPRGAPSADERAAPAPTNPYERSKAKAEAALGDDAARSGALAVIVRPEFVYGPGDHHVLRLFRAIQRRRFVYVGGGEALCHPTYIDDAVRGILGALDRGVPGRIYHLAGPRPVTIRHLAETFAGACGVAPPFVHVPERPMRLAVGAMERLGRALGVGVPIGTTAIDFFTMDRHFSWQRARAELGFEPVVDLAEGARRSVDWYRTLGLLPAAPGSAR